MNQRPRRDVTREKIAEASRLFRMAYARQLDGDIDRALVLYEKSIRLNPTAEAHAYLGWAKSTRTRLDEAIEHCKEAIRLDPSFPNAWNDIGAYLIELGRPDEALFFLKRATRLEKSSRCFPHYNLHRAYLAMGDRERAVRHVQAALDADPEFSPAQDALSELLFPGSSEDRRPTHAEAALAGTPVIAFPPKS